MIKIRLTEEQFEKVKTASSTLNMTVSEILNKAVLSLKRQREFGIPFKNSKRYSKEITAKGDRGGFNASEIRNAVLAKCEQAMKRMQDYRPFSTELVAGVDYLEVPID